MLGIMVGINQKDFFALIVDNGSCMVKAGFTGYDTPRACSLWFAGRPVMFGIMAGMDDRSEPKGQLCSRCLADLAVAYLAGFAGDDICAVFPSVVGMLKMRRILVGMNLKDSTSLVFFSSGMCKAGSARYVAPALCSLCLSAGPPQWWQYMAGFACDDAHRVSLQVLGGAAGAVPERWWTSLCSCSDEIQLSVLTAGMRGRFLRALYTGTVPGAVSTGTRLP